MIWLSKTWEWLKKNWKYVVTFGIPVLLSFIAGLLRSNRSLEKKVEMKEKEIEINKEVSDLGEQLKDRALEERANAIDKVIEKHKDTLARIAADEQERIEAIKSAEDATNAIKAKLNGVSPEMVKPPKFPDPSKSHNRRLAKCPCGSGERYMRCCAVHWSKK